MILPKVSKFIKALIVSQRGVVFFRNQNINVEQQKLLGQKLGELTGKPETSKVMLSISWKKWF